MDRDAGTLVGLSRGDAVARLAGGRSLLLVAVADYGVSDRVVQATDQESYRVDLVRDGRSALQRALTGRYQALLVDRWLPVVNGLDLVVRLRRHGVTTPTIMLAGTRAAADRIAVLDAGADDCADPTIDAAELLARVRAVMRRASADARRLAVGHGSLDLVTRTAHRGDRSTVRLSGRETALLEELATRPGRIVSRSEIHRRVFDTSEDPSIVETYVYYLRRKLGPDIVRTVRGRGYQLGHL